MRTALVRQRPAASGARRPRPSLAGGHGRIRGVDGFRGLAILAMFVDHLCLVFSGPVELRLTVGRLAMPMFFLVAGSLCHGLCRRHLEVLLVGFALPVVVPWIDSPNVLVWWAVGCSLLVGARRVGLPPVLIAVLGLGLAANGWGFKVDGSYDPVALWGLMAVGSAVPLSTYAFCSRMPAVVVWIGARPLRVYVVHLLILQLVEVML